jgi:hypothetical protein
MFGRKKDFKLKLTGRAGLIYEENGKSMRVDSEMLVGPTHDIVIYKDSIKSWAPPFEAEVIDEKNAVEAVKALLTGITNNNSSVLTRDTDRPIHREEKPLPYFNNSINYEDSSRKTNHNFRATNRGFSANRKTTAPKPFKDPDVWDSPPPI